MLWVAYCLDAPNSAGPRQEHRPAHSARLREAAQDPMAEVKPVLYGRLMDDEGAVAEGSLLILEADKREQVEAFLAADPFNTGGVWREIHIHHYAQSTNAPVVLPTS